MPQFDRQVPDSLAQRVFQRFSEALDDGARHLKLDALAYSERVHEKWAVFETYWRVFRDWDDIIDELGALPSMEQWDAHMELPYPRGTGRFDIAFGQYDQNKKACIDTPVFQFKCIGGHNRKKEISRVTWDAETLAEEGMLNGYLFILYQLYPNRARKWNEMADCLAEIKRYKDEVLSAVPRLQSIDNLTHGTSCSWGPYLPNLKADRVPGKASRLWSNCKYCYFADAFRVNVTPQECLNEIEVRE